MNEEILMNLVRRVQSLEQKVHLLETDTLVRKTEIPRDVLEENGLWPDTPSTTKPGRGARPILLSEINDAKKHCKNESECARYLGLSYKCYRKWAKRLSVWNPTK